MSGGGREGIIVGGVGGVGCVGDVGGVGMLVVLVALLLLLVLVPTRKKQRNSKTDRSSYGNIERTVSECHSAKVFFQ